MPLFAETQLATIVFLVGLALTSALLLLRTQRQIRKTNAAPAAKRGAAARPPAAPATGAGQNSHARWEVQMHELARDLSGQLDSKISVLQHLLAQAESQSARLESLLARAQRLAQMAAAEPPSTSASSSSARRSASQAAGLGGAANVRIDASSRAEPASTVARRNEQIYRLADAGHSSGAIAAQIGAPIGEVELILGLRRQES